MPRYKVVKIHGDLSQVANYLNDVAAKEGWVLVAIDPYNDRIEILLKSIKVATQAQKKTKRGCPDCYGSGGKKIDPCKKCEGTGRIPIQL